MRVTLTGRRVLALADVAERIDSDGGRSEIVPVDLLDLDATDQIEAACPDPTVLVASAGIGLRGEALSLGLEEQLDIIRVNCASLTSLTLTFLPKMVARGHGVIVLVASTAGFHPVPRFAVYAASKAYVLSFAQSLDREVSRSGVRVVALCPGPVPTAFQERAGSMDANDRPPWERRDAEQVAGDILSAIASPRSVIVPNVLDRAERRAPGLIKKLKQLLRRTWSP